MAGAFARTLTVGAGRVGGAVATGARPAAGPTSSSWRCRWLDRPGDPLHRCSGFTTVIWLRHPESRGTVEFRSADPTEAPRIRPNCPSHAHDRKVVVEGVRIGREIHASPPFRDLTDAEILPGPEVRTDGEALDFARRTGSTAFHPVGTRRMGADEDAVTSPSLVLRGGEGLYVADASAMPRITSADTNAPTLVIGEKAGGAGPGPTGAPPGSQGGTPVSD